MVQHHVQRRLSEGQPLTQQVANGLAPGLLVVRLDLDLAEAQSRPELPDSGGKFGSILQLERPVHLPEGLQHHLHEQRLPTRELSLLQDLLPLGVEVEVPPEGPLQGLPPTAQLLRVQPSEAGDVKAPAVPGAGEQHVPGGRRELESPKAPPLSPRARRESVLHLDVDL